MIARQSDDGGVVGLLANPAGIDRKPDFCQNSQQRDVNRNCHAGAYFSCAVEVIKQRIERVPKDRDGGGDDEGADYQGADALVLGMAIRVFFIGWFARGTDEKGNGDVIDHV